MDLSDVMLKMDGKMILIFNSKTWDFQTRIIQNMELKIKKYK